MVLLLVETRQFYKLANLRSGLELIPTAFIIQTTTNFIESLAKKIKERQGRKGKSVY